MNEVMAFWKYDSYPYLLGGQVTEIRPGGAVETKEFGKGYYFKPKFFIPLEQGRELKKKLETLEVKYREEREELLRTYIDKSESLIKQFVIGEE